MKVLGKRLFRVTSVCAFIFSFKINGLFKDMSSLYILLNLGKFIVDTFKKLSMAVAMEGVG